jgi:hypothetical protein
VLSLFLRPAASVKSVAFHRCPMEREMIRKSLDDGTLDEFEERVDEQAEFLKDEIRERRLDNPDFTVGLEVEVYAVGGDGRLARVPDDVFEDCGDGLNKELGLHNAEINTSPTVFDDDGLRAQEEQVNETLDEADEALGRHGVEGQRFVLDSIWTVPPAEGSAEYLGSVETDDGFVSAENMRSDSRYEAIDNYYIDIAGDVEIDVPGVSLRFPTILAESLATSVQPHLQIPDSDDLPRYYNTAIRTMAPVLALSTNSPFLPPDLYDDPDASLVDETYDELRIPVFEASVNPPGEYDDKKVRFPRDIDKTVDVVDKVVEDTPYSPLLSEWDDRTDEGYIDEFWEFEYKRGTYWRWLRAVIGGEAVGDNDERSVRIEYRPLPTQPTVRDIIGLHTLVSGALAGMVVDNHPLPSLGWREARDSFYNVVENGIDARMAWVDRDGDVTHDKNVIYDELFEYARLGLEGHGFDDGTYEKYVTPLRTRWEERTTPSVWKKERVREALEDGDSFEEAVHGMQREYISRTDDHETFAEWI